MLNGLGPGLEQRHYRFRQDLRVMRRLFPWRTTAALFLAIGVMAWLFRAIYNHNAIHIHNHDPEDTLTFIRAVYAILNMIFFQLAYTDVPADVNLTPFFVLVPFIGLSLFSLAGFNFLQVLRVFFVRGERGQRWQEALAATYNDHIVVCGLGSIGYRVALQLAELAQPVVGIELSRTELVDKLIDADLPVILGNVRSHDVLVKAGVPRAATVIVCTNHDMANIEAAFHARELSPRARLVVRIFEDEIAPSVAVGAQADAVLSRSAIAAVTIAHAAVGVRVLESFRLGAREYILARVPMRTGSPLVGCTVGEVARDRDATIAFLCRDEHLVNVPLPDTRLQPGDDLFLFAATDRLMALVQRGVPSTAGDGVTQHSDHIVVCGLGHVGYRIVTILQDLGYTVTALDQQPIRLAQRLVAQGARVQINDFRRRSTLAEAGVASAQAIVVCSDDDMLNLETALRARDLKPDIRLVVRIFDEELGRRLSQAFGIDAVFSTSVLAVPAFVGAATNLHLAQAVTIGHEQWALTRLVIEPQSALIGQTVQELNAADKLTVVLHACQGRFDVPPRAEARLHAGDEVVVLVSPDRLRRLSQLNRSRTPAQGRWL